MVKGKKIYPHGGGVHGGGLRKFSGDFGQNGFPGVGG